jgi:hypothetical protein
MSAARSAIAVEVSRAMAKEQRRRRDRCTNRGMTTIPPRPEPTPEPTPEPFPAPSPSPAPVPHPLPNTPDPVPPPEPAS